MAGTRFDKLCRSVLPANYQQVVRGMPAVERFLDENLPPALRSNLTLLKLDESRLVIGAHSPAVANYLRLHLAEIAQQLHESLNLAREIQIRTVPASMLRVDSAAAAAKSAPRAVGGSAIAAIERSADWIDDESLQQALRDLADALKTDSDAE